MKNLLSNEKEVLAYITRKAAANREDKILQQTLAIFNDYLKTINDLRGELELTKKKFSEMSELFAAKKRAYDLSCQERVNLLSENKFLREQLARLKR